ncbi:MAG: N-acetylmuramoyl-L-alanine amidase [Rhodobacteraceae bacterium]|nr:N-acetylmuramoyl-L-alanine amidase [Paracoccaceae bacterium]
MVVIHYTAMESAEAAVERLCDPIAEVSAHYLISEDGSTFPLVSEDMRAWHAGAGAWGWVRDVNSHSIGFELANKGPDSDAPEFPEAQMQTLERILGEVLRRRRIPPERVIGHSDMAPGRKIDPGPHFDWKRLADKGLSVWVEVDPLDADWDRFKLAAETFGYRAVDRDEDSWRAVLDAFRLRFRPGSSGPLEGRDVGTIIALAEKWPCAQVDLGGPKELF